MTNDSGRNQLAQFAFPIVLLLTSAFRLFSAPVCISGNTLATYEALGATGCTIAGLTVKDFTFSVVSSGGGATPLADTGITVTPTFGADFVGAKFASGGFSVSGAGFVNYLIGYTWDPTGDIRGLDDVLDPGTVDILTGGCVGIAFAGASCSGTPVSVHVFEPSQLTDFVAFSPTGVVGIRNNISLSAGGSFNSIENDVFLPEPASFFLAGLGVMIFAAGLRHPRARQDRRRFTATNG